MPTSDRVDDQRLPMLETAGGTVSKPQCFSFWYLAKANLPEPNGSMPRL